MTLLLALLYPLAVQFERGGLWRLLAPVTVFALLIDVVANYTELALLTWDFPQKGEHTFSTRLLRLRYNDDFTGQWCRAVIAYLNYFAPNGKHV